MISTDPILELTNIKHSFCDDNLTHQVFNDFSLKLHQGELMTILGPSGCGKSTLLKIASSLIQPEVGQVRFEGSLQSHPDNQRIMVFQDQEQLFPWLNVEDNIAFPLTVQGGQKGDLNRVSELLDLVGLEQWRYHFPAQLSGGMKQRVALARSLSTRPKILLMDEPFGSLDAQIRRELQDSLINIFKIQGVSILFVTHDIQEALKLGDRIIVLSRDGEVLMEELNPLGEPRNPGNVDFPQAYHTIFSILR